MYPKLCHKWIPDLSGFVVSFKSNKLVWIQILCLILEMEFLNCWNVFQLNFIPTHWCFDSENWLLILLSKQQCSLLISIWSWTWFYGFKCNQRCISTYGFDKQFIVVLLCFCGNQILTTNLSIFIINEKFNFYL